MFRFRKKKQPPTREPMPSWLKWLLVVFLAYGLIVSSKNKSTDTAHQILEKASDELATVKPLDFSAFTSKIFPAYSAALQIREVAPGAGNPVICGQKVTLAYETFLADGKPLGDAATKEAPLVFNTGGGTAMPVFEQGVIGMQKGGKRSLLSPLSMSYGLPQFAREGLPEDAPVRFEIELLDVSPEFAGIESTPYRIAEVAMGQGEMFICGQPTKLHVAVWDTEGKKLYSSRDNDGAPVAFTPGKSQVFLGLEQGVIGMNAGGMRMLVVPPTFQRTLTGDEPEIAIPLPLTKTVLVDIESVP